MSGAPGVAGLGPAPVNVPFYFTPFSVMMFNIHTGRGVPRVENSNIAVLVSSLRRLADQKVPFLFTDRHAYVQLAEYFDDLDQLDRLDCNRLQSRDFTRDPDDPEKMDRCQAEALVHQHLPVDGLIGIMCFNEARRMAIATDVASRSLTLEVHARPSWYF